MLKNYNDRFVRMIYLLLLISFNFTINRYQRLDRFY